MKDTLAYGILTAAFAGVLAGAAMKPASGAFEPKVLGPAMQLSEGERELASNSYSAQTGLTAYDGDIPEYVLGTDSTRPLVYDIDGELYAQAETPPEPVADDPGFTAPVKVSYPPPVTPPDEDEITHVTPTQLVEAPAPQPIASGSG